MIVFAVATNSFGRHIAELNICIQTSCNWPFMLTKTIELLSGVPDYFGRNKISSGGDLSHYSSASLY